ncbi:EKC/KEOPS complex subunit Tp53rk-like [Dendronephthya gigantea]|uniref:EKC/KEOPS complex subunit Tp53rk-like n=1 Tax=Dendronephthya gigantea TaxID=151771 RepID=UPI00106D61C3|nr:EKC/KEOPS complex subunit Tp53rk-like [Dendronephthya gigantea]
MAAENVLFQQGAEAKIYSSTLVSKPVIVKERFKKEYRHPVLDGKLTHRRTSQEVRSMARCRKAGISTPVVYFVDYISHKIYMENVLNAVPVKDVINRKLGQASEEDTQIDLDILAQKLGAMLGKMHAVDVIHGDLTTSNMLLRAGEDIVLIDFGLSYISSLVEDKGVDLYVLERALLSSHPNTELFFDEVLKSYANSYESAEKAEEVLKKLDEVQLRGRKRVMVG